MRRNQNMPGRQDMRTMAERGTVVLALFLIVTIPIAAGCGGDEPLEAASASEADVLALASGGNELALELYSRLAGDGNLFFSPFSISSALGMTAAGARGETEIEMATTLRFPSETIDGESRLFARERVAASFAALDARLTADPATSGYELHVANSLWGQRGYPFLSSYLDLVDAYYGAGFNLVDFERNSEEARLRINEWVEKETREKIEDLIPPGGVNASTALVLTNAVYFKGDWARQFDEERTADAAFHGESGDTDVPLMYQKGDFRYAETEEAQLLEMPYRGGDVSMLVVLPAPERVGSLAALEASLTPTLLAGWTEALSTKEVRVYLPRFEMTWGTENVSSHLRELGMLSAFSSDADFSGMTDRNDLFIGPVFHKAFVAVNEEGTEAAAATAVVMKRTSIEMDTVFRADRPFMFLIRDDSTGSVLFMGRVVDL